MTQTHFTIGALVGALLCAIAATAVVSVSGAALPPPRPAVHPTAHVDVRVGDGIFRLRIHAGDNCRTAVTIEIRLPRRVQSVAPGTSADRISHVARPLRTSASHRDLVEVSVSTPNSRSQTPDAGLVVNPAQPFAYYRVRSRSA